jgi:transglutaminase-like putative cysteine protease
MRIHIRHQTHYDYDREVAFSSQLLRLTPLDHVGQRVLGWRVTASGDRALARSDDGYGNVIHMAATSGAHAGTSAIAEGEVETTDTNGVVRGALERLAPMYFLRDTPATKVDDALAALAAEMARIEDELERMHALMLAIRERVDYELGVTAVETTAAEALAHGRGVCQDHTHIFLAAARASGVPGRYVSGYLVPLSGQATSDASHAWAEAHIPDLGWVGFDVANGICPTEAYVRVAIGLDALEAAPVRGMRRGHADESMRVAVDVRHIHDVEQ